MTEHSSLPEAELHEPKGVSTASADEVYGADGSGSGSWQKLYTMGFEDYNDSGSSQSLSTSFVDLTNDGAGSSTLKTYQLPGFSDIWDTSNNEFDFSSAGLSLGDAVIIRMDVTVTTNGANNKVQLGMDLAHGDASEYQLIFSEHQFKDAAAHQITESATIYIGNSETLSNPAKVIMKSDDASDTVVVNGWAVFVIPRNPVLS